MTTVICFHNPDGEHGYLSNWYPARFRCNGVSFTSAEQCMMYQKARLFQDTERMNDILKETNPSKIKKLGHLVRNYKDEIWERKRRQVVYYANLEKFSQNLELKERLLATKGATLAECAVGDKVWGTGLSQRNPNCVYPKKWTGKNLLGEILMEVRADLAK